MSLVTLGGKPPSFADPVGFLASCHRRIEERLAALERSAAAGATEAMREAVSWLCDTGASHTDDEDVSIFPRLAGADADALLADLAVEHRAAEAILLALRGAVAQGEAGEAAHHANALAAAYRDHIAREEAELFPLVRTLDEAQLRAIGLEMRLRRGGG